MSHRTAALLAWSLAAAFVTLLGLGLAFSALALESPGLGSDTVLNMQFAVIGAGFAAVGTLVVPRRPGNPIGWIFSAAGLGCGISFAAGGYALYAIPAQPDPLTGGATAAWLDTWLWPPSLVAPATFLLLLFPDGRLLSRRWIAPAWLAGGSVSLVALANAVTSGPFGEPFSSVDNPFGIRSLSEAADTVDRLGVLLVTVICAGAVSLVLRFRRKEGDEREQLKWIAYSGASLAVLAAATGPFYNTWAPAPILVALAMLGIPVSAGIAILKYRLYDIDVLIRRTLVYGVLTALLAGVYFGLVLALEQVTSPITRGSDLAVAGSTLVVAALFRPARRRIQGLVDRRFYRSKVDAARTLEDFSARLRREIELESLTAELGGVVERTLQPAHVSLWLAPEEARP